jgi:hypothetical protein
MKKYLLLISLLLLIPINSLADDKVMVQIVFTEDININGATIPFTDAIYYTPEAYANLDKDTLDKRKQERIDNQIDRIKNPAPVIEPTTDDLIKEQSSIDEQIVSLQNRKLEIDEKIKEKKPK